MRPSWYAFAREQLFSWHFYLPRRVQWETSRPGPRVVEEWPKVCSGGGGGSLGVEERMSNNNYGGGQGKNWQTA
jgi:hypothetical protein